MSLHKILSFPNKPMKHRSTYDHSCYSNPKDKLVKLELNVCALEFCVKFDDSLCCPKPRLMCLDVILQSMSPQ